MSSLLNKLASKNPSISNEPTTEGITPEEVKALVASLPTKEIEEAEEDILKTEQAITVKQAHIQALEQGLRVFKQQRLNMVVLSNGQKVRPTNEGFFIALTPELERQLDHYATKVHGQVEEVKIAKED